MALVKHGTENAKCRWIKNMLSKKRVHPTLFGETMEVSVAKGSPQGRVLSSLPWNLVVDELLVNLNSRDFYIQEYADDTVILILWKFDRIVFEHIQQALNLVENWSRKENISVNPDKTVLVPFTKRRKLDGLKPPIFFGIQLQYNRENTINKGKMVIMAIKRAIGKI